jgi:hypothetical protein
MTSILQTRQGSSTKYFTFLVLFWSSFAVAVAVAVADNNTDNFYKIYLAIALTFIGTVIVPIAIEWKN